MRKDVTLNAIIKGGDKINKSALARQYGCCWETIDRRLNPDKYKRERKKRIYTSILDKYKVLIDEKIENNNIPATGIYFLLKEKYNYEGKYGIVRKYVSEKKKNIINELTIRFETIKGYQSQVDWKEKIKLHDIYENEYVISIFLIVLGNSRYKYIELTFDQTQSTLFSCLINAFKYFGGSTKEILFDNMKTIVDHAKSTYTNVIINSKAEQFSKDVGFKIVTCRPYRPRTKGKVETLAKIMNRLKAFDKEFKNWNELNDIVKKLNYNLNYEEKSQATNEIPNILFQKEKEYLIPVNVDILKNYYIPEKTYKVSNESMITYKGIKYSVPIQYVGKQITVLDEDNVIHLYYNTKLIYSYNKNKKYKYNYKENDYVEILKNSSFDKKTNEEIDKFIINNLESMDQINIERK
ncbi:MAG: IS21 family transposase [Tenericutes bacterium]|nr:IS21 family transposase [Mycoplasmatota bacterium]MDY3802111.1 IS21 family transposase [Bacilli bacterium]